MKRIAILALVLSLVPAAASAQEQAAGATPATEPIGLNLDLGVASAYVFRGLNVFAGQNQLDQHAFVAPSATWTGLDGRLQLGYWGAYQLVGDNVGSKIDAAAGAETDLTVKYTQKITESFGASAGAVLYLYPMADERIAGTATPTVIEPVVGLHHAGAVDVELKLSYFLAAQRAIESWRYLYINPTVGKAFALTDAIGLAGAVGFGYKAAADFESNVLDAIVTVAAPMTFGSLYAKPGVSATWTDLEGLEPGDELVVFGSVNVGTDL